MKLEKFEVGKVQSWKSLKLEKFEVGKVRSWKSKEGKEGMPEMKKGLK